MIYLFQDCKSESSSFISKGGVLTKRAVWDCRTKQILTITKNIHK